MKKMRLSSHSIMSHGSVVGCLLFILMLTITVRGQISAAEASFSTGGKHLVSMIFIGSAVVLAGIWNVRCEANMGSMICSLGVLAAVGSSYQMIFPGSYSTYLISMLLCAITAVFFYHFQRRVMQISNAVFIGLAVLSVGLMLALLKFGTVENNALLGIEITKGKFFRPAEFVKVLVIYLGAHSYRDKLRQTIFCIVSLLCCLLCIKCDDLGAAVIIFANFVVLTYLLFDSRLFSTFVVVGAAVGLWAVLEFTGYGAHAKLRLRNLFHAMEQMAGQQRGFLRSLIFGGFSGLGLGRTELMSDIFAIHTDGCLAGVMSVYGIPVLLITMLAYGVLTCAPAYNRSLTPMGYMLLTQMSTYVFCHSFLSLAGSTDLVPFTGLATPVISVGINAFVAFGILIGLACGSLHPTNCLKE